VWGVGSAVWGVGWGMRCGECGVEGKSGKFNVRYGVVTRKYSVEKGSGKFGVQRESGKWKFGVGSEIFDGKCEMQKMRSEEPTIRSKK